MPAADLTVPAGLDFSAYDAGLAGSPDLWDDYAPGERIDHLDSVTLEESEQHDGHPPLAEHRARPFLDHGPTRGAADLWRPRHQPRPALAFNGLANAQAIAAINAGTHAAPAGAGDTVTAWSEVLDRAETAAPGVGALRLRTVAVKNRPAGDFPLRGEDGRHAAGVILDLDYWALMPRRA